MNTACKLCGSPYGPGLVDRVEPPHSATQYFCTPTVCQRHPSSPLVIDLSPLAEPDRVRALLITLPDAADFMGHYRECIEADAEAEHRAAPEMRVSGAVMRAVMTYPELRAGRVPILPAYVYIAARGYIRWRHAVQETAALTLTDLTDMDELVAVRMRLGAPYLWVFARPERVAVLPAPPYPLAVGWASRSHPLSPEALSWRPLP